MLNYHPYSILLLAALLAPSLIVGAIVAFKTRSGWALPLTVLGSMAGGYLIPTVYTYIAALTVRLLRPIFGTSLDFIYFDPQGFSRGGGLWGVFQLFFHLPIMLSVGLCGGAILTGMILLACKEAKQKGSKFSIAHIVVSAIGTTIAGAFLTMFLILLLTMLMGIGGWFLNGFPLFDANLKASIAAIGMILSMLVGGAITGFLSAIAGTRFATFLI
jgi:hypothetical protein